MNRALPPSKPPDGGHLRCLRLAAVGGARPHGGWHPSAIARLQGFSSCSPAAFPHQWSSRMMTTSSVVGRSKPGCGLSPALSFKDLRHPCCGGGRAELGFYLPHGPAGRLFLQHSGERALTSIAEGANFDNAGSVDHKHRQLQRAWLAGSASSVAASDAASCHLIRAWSSVHRTGDCRVARKSGMSVALPALPTALGDRPRRRTPLGRRSCSWIVLSSLQHDASARRPVPARPRGLEWGSAGVGWGGRHSSVWRWRAGGRSRRCQGGGSQRRFLRRRDCWRHLRSDPRLSGFGGLSSPLVWGRG
jgi:hypothetical protein